jgi:hypothetical protein
MEQMINGQIGQPAACMIENKAVPLRAQRFYFFRVGDYGPIAFGLCRRKLRAEQRFSQQSPASVDNFVGNRVAAVREPRELRRCERLPKT